MSRECLGCANCHIRVTFSGVTRRGKKNLVSFFNIPRHLKEIKKLVDFLRLWAS